MNTARLSALIGELYGSTLDSSARRAIAPKFAGAFDAESCLIFSCDLRSGDAAVISATDNLTDKVLGDYAAYYHTQDRWATQAIGLPTGQAILGVDCISESDLVRTEIYTDVMAKIGVHSEVGGVIESNGGRVGFVGVHRPAQGPEFDSESLETMRLLLPHLRQAISFAARFGAETLGKRIGMEALEALAIGVAVVGRDRSVKLMNEAAERVVRAGRGVLVRHGRLSLARQSLDTALRVAIETAALAPFGNLARPGAVITVPDTEPGSAISLTVTPLHPAANPGGPTEPLAVVFFRGEEAPSLPLPDLLRKAYGLTAAEARVLLAVVSGARLADHAEEQGVRLETVRSQLKQVFGKTGCSRQADLVRLVLTNPIFQLADVRIR